MTAEGTDGGENSVCSGNEWRDDESESSGEGIEMVTSEADDAEKENIPFVLRRVA